MMMGIVKERNGDVGVIDRFLCSSMRFAIVCRYPQSYTGEIKREISMESIC